MKKLIVLTVFLILFSSCATKPHYTMDYGGTGGLIGAAVEGKNGFMVGNRIGGKIGFVLDTANMIVGAGKGIVHLFVHKPKKIEKITFETLLNNYQGYEGYTTAVNRDLIYPNNAQIWKYEDRADSDIPETGFKKQFNYFVAL